MTSHQKAARISAITSAILLALSITSHAADAPGQEEPVPIEGHLHIGFSNSTGANLKADAVDAWAREILADGFLQTLAGDSDNPLAPCALLAASIIGMEMNVLFYEILTPGQLRTPPMGTNIFGKYDWKMLFSRGNIPKDEPNIAADIIARLMVIRSWGSNAVLNTYIQNKTQAGCLTAVADVSQLRSVLGKKASSISLEHTKPVSLFYSWTSREEGNKFLDQLLQPTFLDRPASDRSNPLAPCILLRSFRLAARVNDAWLRISEGKPDIEEGSPLMPIKAELQDKTLLRNGTPRSAELVARAYAAEINRANELTDLLTAESTQRECVEEVLSPGTIRLRLIEKGINLPLR